MTLQSSHANRLIDHGSFEAIWKIYQNFGFGIFALLCFFLCIKIALVVYSCVRSKFISKNPKKKIPLVVR